MCAPCTIRRAPCTTRVTAADVAIGASTLLIYTPHTLYITCPVPTASR